MCKCKLKNAEYTTKQTIFMESKTFIVNIKEVTLH